MIFKKIIFQEESQVFFLVSFVKALKVFMADSSFYHTRKGVPFCLNLATAPSDGVCVGFDDTIFLCKSKCGSGKKYYY